MKIRCPPCSHVPGSSIGDYVAIYVGPFPPPWTKTSHRSTPTSQPNPITFRTLTNVVNLSLLFVANTFARNGQAFVPIFRNYLRNFLSNYSDYIQYMYLCKFKKEREREMCISFEIICTTWQIRIPFGKENYRIYVISGGRDEQNGILMIF